MKEKIISPSLLSANFLKLSEEVQMLNDSQAEWIHLDIMDGVFVPNISYGLPIVKAVSKVATKPCDVHLMIQNPDLYIETFAEAGADILHVHYEASIHLHRTIQSIHSAGMKAGVVLNPHTPVFLLQNILPYVDVVLIMSVNPGFGGQQFIEETYEKILELDEMRRNRDLHFLIEVDGGVTDKNASKLFSCGANVLVAGSFVFGAKNPQAAIESMLK